MTVTNGNDIRAVLLSVVAELAPKGPGMFQSGSVIREAYHRLGFTNLSQQQALLTYFHDLFRQGYLSWGYDISNPEPPFIHLTTQGASALEQFGRDPANPAGYLAFLNANTQFSAVTDSYIREALKTYNSDCIKAAAVMVGAAAESIVLDVRDNLIARHTALGRTPPPDLSDWRIKRILDTLKTTLDAQKRAMPRPLSEAFDAYWPAFTQQIRTARNDAGHPTSVDPVTPETVHASLLIFPELAKLANEMNAWILTSFT